MALGQGSTCKSGVFKATAWQVVRNAQAHLVVLHFAGLNAFYR